MNGTYYPNPTFPNTVNENLPRQEMNGPSQESLLMEQSYIENILRLNKGKKVTIYATFPDANDWRDKQFTGIIEEAGRDHIILRDVQEGKWYLILMIYLNFVEADEKFNYSHAYSEKTF